MVDRILPLLKGAPVRTSSVKAVHNAWEKSPTRQERSRNLRKETVMMTEDNYLGACSSPVRDQWRSGKRYDRSRRS